MMATSLICNRAFYKLVFYSGAERPYLCLDMSVVSEVPDNIPFPRFCHKRGVKKRRIGHFAWYSNHTMSHWVKLRGEFAAYSFVSQQMALYLCIAV